MRDTRARKVGVDPWSTVGHRRPVVLLDYSFEARGWNALTFRTGNVVVRDTVHGSPWPSSMVRVVSDTCTVTIWPACSRPRLTRCRQTRITPVLAARRCTVTGSLDGR